MISPATLQRLKTASGHLDAVIRMVEDGRYCIDVLHQIGAVQGAIEQARRAVLEDHLRTCVQDAYAAGRVDDMVDELLGVCFDDPSRAAVRCAKPAPDTDVGDDHEASPDARPKNRRTPPTARS